MEKQECRCCDDPITEDDQTVTCGCCEQEVHASCSEQMEDRSIGSDVCLDCRDNGEYDALVAEANNQ